MDGLEWESTQMIAGLLRLIRRALDIEEEEREAERESDVVLEYLELAERNEKLGKEKKRTG